MERSSAETSEAGLKHVKSATAGGVVGAFVHLIVTAWLGRIALRRWNPIRLLSATVTGDYPRPGRETDGRNESLSWRWALIVKNRSGQTNPVVLGRLGPAWRHVRSGLRRGAWGRGAGLEQGVASLGAGLELPEELLQLPFAHLPLYEPLLAQPVLAVLALLVHVVPGAFWGQRLVAVTWSGQKRKAPSASRS